MIMKAGGGGTVRRWFRRLITLIGHWGFTIMIVPKRGSVKRIAVPWLGVIVLAAAIGVIAYFPIGRIESFKQQSRIRHLQAVNDRLNQENKQIKPALDRTKRLETIINRLKNEVASVNAVYRSVQRKSPTRLSSRGGDYRRSACRLPPPVLSATDGEVSMLATLTANTDSLTKESMEELARVRELKTQLLAYERQLDHTPSNWPVSGFLTSWFGYRRDPVTRYSALHTGIDLSARYGTSVKAAAAGKIEFAGWRGGYGWAVVIDHGYGYKTLYGHNSALLVTVGQTVKKGQIVAHSGSSGKSTGPHVHFEVWVNSKKVNPLTFLR
jgi:murein DD-endopeptidase MepM/ murein hydrolase activator NlpD